SGVAVVEGTQDPQILTKLSHLSLVALEAASDLSLPQVIEAKISPTGGFRFTGVRPGMTKISLPGSDAQSGFSLLRVERHGAMQRDGITVGPGEPVTGVRLVFA